ncbi:MAG: transposase, partial [Solirubrobacterales bacterium]|nr:transposase [Solirubrobacterales bacterium]
MLYAYAVGERSSRGIERRCREDVVFRVIMANRVPDHTTIARFRARHEGALAEIFLEELLAGDVPAREHEAVLVHGHVAPQPIGVRHGADEDETAPSRLA